MEQPNEPLALRPSASVREIETQDGAVLLDLQQGVCLSLNPVGAKIWKQLKLRCSVGQVADQLASEFNVPSQQVSEDVWGFIEELARKALLVTGGQNHPGCRLNWLVPLVHRCRPSLHSRRTASGGSMRLLFWKAFLGLLFFDLLGLGNDFPSIHTLVRNWTIVPGVLPPDAAIERVCAALNFACIWYPKRVLCLQRSIVTTCMLRICGVPARMVLGAQKLPFKAHAWVEVDGRAVNEQSDAQTTYLVWDWC